LNDDIYDLSDLQIESSIHLTTSTFRIQTYEEEIDRRAKICISFNEIFAIFQNHQFRNESDQTNEFFSFNNFVDYDLTLWFQKVDCTKKNVTSFFKSERLKSFQTNFEQLKSFRTRLSFKNKEEWLRQLNRIMMSVHKNDWQEQKLVVDIDTDENTTSNMIVQYKDIKKIIDFLIEHSSFASDLVYASIRQYIDNDVRMYNEMHTIDWWWKTQKRLFENVTIISLFIITNKIIFTKHHDDVTTWSMYLTIENLKIEIRRKQTRSSNLFLNFIFIVFFDNHDNIKTNVWHKVVSIMLKRKYIMRHVIESIYVNKR
jgi:hypothetical protein